MAVTQSLAVDQIGQSIEGNYSTVRIRWTSTQTGSSRNGFTRTAYYYISINGGAEQEYTVSYTLPANTTQVILDTTITVPHSADGTGTVAVRTWMDTNISAGVVRTSKTVNLSTIPRATTATVGALTMGMAGTISLSPASSAFRHTLVYYFGSLSGTIATKTAATSVSWTPPKSFAEQIPSNTVGIGSIHCITYSGDTEIGETSTPITVTVSDDAVPTISVALSDPTKVSDTYGGYVQLRSRLKVAITAAGVYGSSIKAYSVKVGDIYTGASANNTTDYLPSAGTLAVSCTVTDSRGRTAAWTRNITVIAYARPQVSAIAAARCNADGTANWSGAYGKVTFSAAISSLSGKNTARYTVQYREHGATDWLTAAVTEEGDYNPTDVSVVFAAAKSTRYEVRVLATDRWEGIGSTVRDLPAAFALLHNCKSMLSVGIGRLCDKLNALQVALDAYFDRSVTVDGALTVGDGAAITGALSVTGAAAIGGTLELGGNAVADSVIECGTSGAWTYRKWSSGIAECWRDHTGQPDCSATWGALYESQRFGPLNFPSGLFAAAPTVLMIPSGTSGANVIGLEIEGMPTATQSAMWYYLRAATNTVTMTVTIAVHAIGRWK